MSVSNSGLDAPAALERAALLRCGGVFADALRVRLRVQEHPAGSERLAVAGVPGSSRVARHRTCGRGAFGGAGVGRVAAGSGSELGASLESSAISDQRSKISTLTDDPIIPHPQNTLKYHQTLTTGRSAAEAKP